MKTFTLVAIVVLYCLGHWIGASLLLAYLLITFALAMYSNYTDPLGVYSLLRNLHSYHKKD